MEPARSSDWVNWFKQEYREHSPAPLSYLYNIIIIEMKQIKNLSDPKRGQNMWLGICKKLNVKK